MKFSTWLSAIAISVLMLFGSTASARHVTVSYVDANRPPEYAMTDVLSGIQRAMREWEAHNVAHGIVFHWGGVISLSNAPEDFNNIVIRWAPNNYSSFVGLSCNSYSGCAGSPPLSSNHILLATWWDSPTFPSPSGRWNNPRFIPGVTGGPQQDMVGVLTHELAHLLRNTNTHNANSVLFPGASFGSRYLWSSDIVGVDTSRYNPHAQAFQLFSINGSTGAMSVLRHTVPTDGPVHSPAGFAVGDGVAGSGSYAIAYNTSGASVGTYYALRVKYTDGVSNDVTRTLTGTQNGLPVAWTYHKPCVAISASGNDHYLAWASPVELTGGWREVLTVESHNNRGSTWTAPFAIPGAYTRSGINCAIDRATERLVVTYTGAGEDGIWITHRSSLTSGAAWSSPIRVTAPMVFGQTPSTHGPPDIAFDFFSATTPGVLSWQDNNDLAIHSTSIVFSGGNYVTALSMDVIHPTDPTLLRSWPTVTFESNRILGSSLFTVGGLHSENRRGFDAFGGLFSNSDTYTVGAVHAARRYTGAASNRLSVQRAFLSTANTGL
jgi:hypothetical protein